MDKASARTFTQQVHKIDRSARKMHEDEKKRVIAGSRINENSELSLEISDIESRYIQLECAKRLLNQRRRKCNSLPPQNFLPSSQEVAEYSPGSRALVDSLTKNILSMGRVEQPRPEAKPGAAAAAEVGVALPVTTPKPKPLAEKRMSGHQPLRSTDSIDPSSMADRSFQLSSRSISKPNSQDELPSFTTWGRNAPITSTPANFGAGASFRTGSLAGKTFTVPENQSTANREQLGDATYLVKNTETPDFSSKLSSVPQNNPLFSKSENVNFGGGQKLPSAAANPVFSGFGAFKSQQPASAPVTGTTTLPGTKPQPTGSSASGEAALPTPSSAFAGLGTLASQKPFGKATNESQQANVNDASKIPGFSFSFQKQPSGNTFAGFGTSKPSTFLSNENKDQKTGSEPLNLSKSTVLTEKKPIDAPNTATKSSFFGQTFQPGSGSFFGGLGSSGSSTTVSKAPDADPKPTEPVTGPKPAFGGFTALKDLPKPVDATLGDKNPPLSAFVFGKPSAPAPTPENKLPVSFSFGKPSLRASGASDSQSESPNDENRGQKTDSEPLAPVLTEKKPTEAKNTSTKSSFFGQPFQPASGSLFGGLSAAGASTTVSKAPDADPKPLEPVAVPKPAFGSFTASKDPLKPVNATSDDKKPPLSGFVFGKPSTPASATTPPTLFAGWGSVGDKKTASSTFGGGSAGFSFGQPGQAVVKASPFGSFGSTGGNMANFRPQLISEVASIKSPTQPSSTAPVHTPPSTLPTKPLSIVTTASAESPPSTPSSPLSPVTANAAAKPARGVAVKWLHYAAAAGVKFDRNVKSFSSNAEKASLRIRIKAYIRNALDIAIQLDKNESAAFAKCNQAIRALVSGKPQRLYGGKDEFTFDANDREQIAFLSFVIADYFVSSASGSYCYVNSVQKLFLSIDQSKVLPDFFNEFRFYLIGLTFISHIELQTFIISLKFVLGDRAFRTEDIENQRFLLDFFLKLEGIAPQVDIKKITDARGKALMLSTFEYILQAVDADERQVPVSWIAYLTAFLYNKSLPASYVATLTKILKKLIEDDVTPTIAEIGTKLPAIENLVPMLTRMHEAVRAKARHVLEGLHRVVLRASPVPFEEQ